MTNLYETRTNLYHLARTAENPETASNVYAAIDRLETRMTIEQRNEAAKLPEDDDERRYSARGTPEYRASFDTYIRRGPDALGKDEYRALAADVDPQGGYVVLPEQTSERVILAVDNSVVMRQLATRVEVVGAHSVGVPVVVNDPADADWVTELNVGTEDGTTSLGKRELYPWPAAKLLKASSKLLQRARNAADLIAQRLAYKIGVTQEKAFLTGDGNKKPLGIFTASTSGISTARDVSTGNAATSIGGDGLSNALYSLKERYFNSPSLRWIFHRDAVKQIRQLKDATTGIYYFDPAAAAGQPDRILGVPVLLSEYAPNTFTTGLYVGIVGDLSHYWIADAGQIVIQRLSELFIASGLVGFISRFESDGAPALEDAFARVKLA